MCTRPKVIAPFQSARAMLRLLHCRRRFDMRATNANVERDNANDEGTAFDTRAKRRVAGQVAPVRTAPRKIAPMTIERTGDHGKNVPTKSEQRHAEATRSCQSQLSVKR